MHRILIVLLLALCALALIAHAKPVQSASAEFDGLLELKGEHPLKITLTGKVYWSSPRLRVDFTQNLTQETLTALVDFDEQLATLLYPDTLNGQQFDLKTFEQADYLGRVRDLVSTAPGETPAGWKSSKVDDKSAATMGQTHTLLTGRNGEKVDLWRGKDSKPVKMLVSTVDWTMSLDLENVKYNETISPNTFTYSRDYSITKLEQLPAGSLPGV
jgi:hypothetical protein